MQVTTITSDSVKNSRAVRDPAPSARQIEGGSDSDPLSDVPSMLIVEEIMIGAGSKGRAQKFNCRETPAVPV